MIRLKEHQEKALEAILKHRRFMLADEAGVGKTYPAIFAALAASQAGEAKRILVLCPKSLVEKWQVEWERVTGFRPAATTGQSRKKRELLLRTQPVLIMNYDTVRLHTSLVSGFDFVILDESQRIRGDSQLSKAVLTAFERTPWIVELTGTPMVRGPEDLYSQIQLIRQPWRSRYHFENLFVNFALHGSVRAYRNLDLLRKIMAECSMRRTRKEVLDLPPDVVEIHHLDMTTEQERAYREVVEEAKVRIRDTEGNHLELDVRNMYVRAAQVSDGFKAGIKNEQRIEVTIENSKLNWLRESIDELVQDSKHVVLWSQYLKPIWFVSRFLDETRITNWTIMGEDAIKVREAKLAEWRAKGGIILAQIQTCGVGLNMQEASCQIFWRPPFTPGEFEQAKSRLVRYGQKNQVRSLVLVNRHTLDVSVMRALDRRQNVMAQITTHNLVKFLEGRLDNKESLRK